MKIEATIKLRRNFNPSGNPTEEESTYEVLVAATVQSDEVGPVTVVDAPEVDGPLARRVRTFSPLRGHEATQAAEAIWDEYIRQEAQDVAKERGLASATRIQQATMDNTVREFLATLRRRRLSPQDALKTLAGALEVA